MALKVKAVEKKIKFTKDENNPGDYDHVMFGLWTLLEVKSEKNRAGITTL